MHTSAKRNLLSEMANFVFRSLKSISDDFKKPSGKLCRSICYHLTLNPSCRTVWHWLLSRPMVLSADRWIHKWVLECRSASSIRIPRFVLFTAAASGTSWLAHPYLLDFARLVLHLNPKVTVVKTDFWVKLSTQFLAQGIMCMRPAGQCHSLPDKFFFLLIVDFCHILRKHDGIPLWCKAPRIWCVWTEAHGCVLTKSSWL